MSVGIETLFTSALGLQPPWPVGEVKLDTAKRRIDFEVLCQGTRLACAQCGGAEQRIHDRLRRSWRPLDFVQFDAWLHADVPRVACTSCNKSTQMNVPWAREGSGFIALSQALALCRRAVVMLSWARRSRLEPFKKLARTISERIDAVVHGMTDNWSNALVEAMNGLVQQARARCTTLQNCIHLHRYRLPAPFQAHTLAPSSVRASPDKMRMPRSTRNGIEPQNNILLKGSYI